MSMYYGPVSVQMLMQSNSPIPPELARHEASKFKPGNMWNFGSEVIPKF